MIIDPLTKIQMLAASATFKRNSPSELFGFWYFGDDNLPATLLEKRAFFSDLMNGRCCQLSLTGSLDQIWEIIELSGQATGKLPPYLNLVDAVAEYGSIRVPFEELLEPSDTSLHLTFPACLTDGYDDIVGKVTNRGDVVELTIEPEWSLMELLLGRDETRWKKDGYDAQLEPPEVEDEDEGQIDSEDDSAFPLTEYDLQFVGCDVINFTRKLIERSQPTPKQLIGLAHALHALECLPAITPGISVEYGLQLRKGDDEFAEFKYWSVSINEESFKVTSGGSVYDSSVGSDSYSGFKLYVEAGSYGYRECNDGSYGWIESAVEVLSLGGVLNVSDYSEPDCIKGTDEL